MAEVKMPAKRMCVSRGQGPVISPYPWITEKADLTAGRSGTELGTHCSSLKARVA